MKLEHVPEGHTLIFEAPQRWGKTLSAVIWALEAYQKGRTVFSNIQLGFPHEPLEFSEMTLNTSTTDGEKKRSKFWGGHIFIDELNFYFNGRRSMSEGNLEAGAFLLQQKKQGCNLTGTTHELESLDVILRMNYDFLIQPEVFPAYPEAPKVVKMKITNGPLQARYSRTIKLPAEPFLGLYDSFAVYDPFKALRNKKANKRRHIEL